MSISVALTAVYEPSKLRREKVLNSSDRVERQVKSYLFIYSGLQFSCKKYVTVSWSESSQPGQPCISGLSADVTEKKAEKSVNQTVFMNIIGPSFLSTAHLQRSSKDADLCAFHFNFRRRRG